MMLFVRVLDEHMSSCYCYETKVRLTHFLKLSRILISTSAWWWNLFLLRMILIATDSPVQ